VTPANTASLRTLSPLMEVLAGPSRPAMREPQNFRTLFSTLNHDDAICAGFEEAEFELGEEGGFEVHFDGRGMFPKVVLNLADGEVVGADAILQLAQALTTAAKMAARMEGK